MVRTLYDPSYAKGAFNLDKHAKVIPKSELYINEVDQKALYQHFTEAASKFRDVSLRRPTGASMTRWFGGLPIRRRTQLSTSHIIYSLRYETCTLIVVIFS